MTLTTSIVTSCYPEPSKITWLWCYLRKEQSEVRYGPYRNWRNTNQVEPDAVKDPIKPAIALALRLCFYCTRKHMKLTIWNFTWIFFTIFANLPPPSKCHLMRPAFPAPPLLCLCILLSAVHAHVMMDSKQIGRILILPLGCVIMMSIIILSHSWYLVPAILLMTRASVAHCSSSHISRWWLLPSVGRWSMPTAVQFQWRAVLLCREHIINLVIGVSRPPVLDCGMIFHPDCGGWDFPSILSDTL